MLGAAFPIIPTLGDTGEIIVGPRLAWPNGYRYRIRHIIAKEIHQQPSGGQGWVKLRIANAALKSVANGGHVVNDATWPDIRPEMGSGLLLKSELESWNAATGALVVYLLLSNFSDSSDYTVLLYYGKAGIAAAESDPIACWAGFDQSVKMSTGADMSGNSRHFTLTGVTAGTLFNGAAGDFG
jgi:hypothetical protein